MFQLINKRLIIGLTLIFGVLLLAVPAALAGGWAVITLDQLPVQIVAEQPVSVGFMVRQHGRTPMTGLSPQVNLVYPDTGESFMVTAEPEGQTGHYVASLTFPQAGIWNWSIEAFTADQPMPTLTVLTVAEASSVQVKTGQELFVAKGCITCHRHDAVGQIPNIQVNTGPNLTHYPTTAEYLRVWLKDPTALKPATQMPNLGLNQPEIEALTAFLLKPESSDEAELFLTRDRGAKGPLVAYDMANKTEQFRLPPGLLAANGKHYYATVTQPNVTFLEVFNPNTGQLENKWALAGHLALSGVSPAGRWLALTRVAGEDEKQTWLKENQWQTEVQVIDSSSGQVAHTLKLDGNFEVETVSATGDALFLIQHVPAMNPDHYLIRLYDLAREELLADPLRDKAEPDEVMTGLAWGGVASPDGRWLLTLYLNTVDNIAFIHALNLVDKYPICIDLPASQSDFDQLKYYTLTLAPDGRTVYAANAALGIVAEVNLDEFKVIRQTEFAPSASSQAETNSETPTNYSVLSKDGQILYFSSGWDVWGYNTKSHQVNGLYLSNTSVRGLGLNEAEQQLYIATNQQPLVLDLASDKTLSFQVKP